MCSVHERQHVVPSRHAGQGVTGTRGEASHDEEGDKGHCVASQGTQKGVERSRTTREQMASERGKGGE